jgi:uncharacterized surface anchored protein
MKKKVKKRFFAILLLLAIVFSNVGVDFFYVQASSIEANESVQEENTETITDTGNVEIGTDSVSDTEEVSESTETVEDTEKVAESTETVADTEVIDTEEDIPEEAAPEEEQIPDQEYTWRDTTAERNLYYDDWSKENMGRIYLGETLEELFQMYEDPTLEMAGWEDFFEGTCFAGATLEDLKWLQESGYTMDQLIQIASDNNRSSVWQMLSGIALMAAYKDKTVSFGGATKTGHIPAFGKRNAPLYTMSMGGKKAFCADCGKHMSSSTVLSYVSEVNTTYIKKAMAYADNGGYYPFSQFYIWAGGNKENYCKGYAQFNYSMMHQDLSYDQIAALTNANASYASLYKEAEKSYDSISNTSTSGVHVYMYSNGNSSYQRIYALIRTPEIPAPDPDPGPTPTDDPVYADVSADAEAYVDANVSLNVVKKDNVTGQGLAGAVFNFFKDGGFEGSGTTDGNGNVSFSFTTSYYGAASSSKTYCTNYGSLTDDKKATVSTYTSYDAAYNAAYNEAYTKALNAANAAKNSTSHNYSATEVTARNGYYLNPGNTTVGQSAAGDASLNLSLANVRTTGSITITKEDSETGAIAQGDATLSGAVYGLYARNNIVHPDGHTGILYTAGTLVATFPATDENRQARLNNLYLGNYYVKEITPSTGYLLDTKEYDVAVTYEGQDVPNVVRTSTVTEDVIKGNIRLVKHLQEKDPSAASRPQVPEVGAEFDIILKSSGVTYAHIVTDADGFAQANMLPYGNYIVRQTKGKEGYSFITDFEVFIRAHERTYSYILENLDYTSQLQVLKKDAETGELVKVAGAKFEIYNEAGKKIVQTVLYPTKYDISVFETDESGMLELPQWLGSGNYTLKEVQAPEGYILNPDPIPFKVFREYEEKDKWGDSVIRVVCEDVSVKGIIDVTKVAPVLTAYEDGKFIYTEERVRDVRFQIIAAEDIYRADRQTDAEGNLITLYKKGDIVETLVTDPLGEASSMELPLGKYRVKEIYVPGGIYLDQEEIEVELKYEDDRTEIVFSPADFYDQRQEIEIGAFKYDTKTNKAIPGVEITIYANRDILDYYGNVLVKKGDAIRSIVTDNDGKADFGKDLPLNAYAAEGDDPDVEEPMYYMKETKFPVGYLPEDNTYFIYSSTPDMTVQFVKENVNVSNVHVDGIIKVTKTAPVLTGYDENGRFVYTDERIHDVKFQIIAAEDIYRADCDLTEDGELIPIYKKDEVIQVLTTDKDGYAETSKLPLGKYRVKEIYVPGGIYLDQEEIDVELKYADDDTEIVYENADFYDQRQQIEVSVYKYDKLTDKAIGGVEVSLYANRDILDYYGNLLVQKGTLIRKGITDNAGRYVFSTDIPLNAYAREQEKTDSEDKDEEEPMYYLIESKFPDGYIPNDIVYYIDSRTPKMTIRNTSENVDISNDPLQAELEVDKSAPKFASPGGTLRFTVSKVTNQCMYEMDEFTLTDILPEHVKLSVLNTGTFKNPRSHVVSYSIWFKTNYDSEWRAWRTGIQSNEAQELKVADMGLGEDEYVTQFQYRFGTVPPFFEVDENPYYDVVVDRDVDMDTVLVNHIKLTGNKFGKYLTSEDETETRLLYGKIRASINGKNGNGGWFVHTNGSPKTGDQGNLAGAVLVLIAGIMLIAASIKKRKGNKVRGMKVHIFILFTVVSAFAFSDHTYAADSTVVKENRYTTNSSDDLHADYDEKIIEDNTFYKLKKVEYEVIDKSQVIVDKSVLSDLMLDTDEYDPPEEIKEDGLIYRLVDVKQIDSETLDQEVSGFDDYEKKISEEDVPQTKTLKIEDLRTGEEMEVECPLSGIEVLDGGTLIQDSIDITFEDYSLGVFEWNGTYVRSDDEYPLKGYEKDLLKSVGLSPSIYSVRSIAWSGEPYTDENGVNCRDAVAEIQHYGYLYRANYSSHIKYVKYEASYENAENDNFNYVIKATAVYEKVVPVTQAVFYAGIGILIFCILLVLIMYLVSRNKKEDGKSSEKEKGGNAL